LGFNHLARFSGSFSKSSLVVWPVALSIRALKNVAVTAHNPFAIDFQRLLIVDIIDGYEKFFCDILACFWAFMPCANLSKPL